MSQQKRLGTHIQIWIALILVVPALIISFMISWFRYNQLVTESTDHAEQLADSLASNLATPLWNYIYDDVEAAIRPVLLDTNVAGVTLFESNDIIFYQFQRSHKFTDTVTFSKPVSQFGSVIGEVDLVYSPDHVSEQAKSEVIQIVGLLLLQLLLVIIFLFRYLKKNLLIPIERSRSFSDAIAKQDFEYEPPSSDFYEFEQLNLSLQKLQKDLGNAVMNLESSVEKRTRELSKVNSMLSKSFEEVSNAKDALVQSEKLAALGSLVAGVAHELNTPLGNGKLMASSLKHELEHIQKQLESGALSRPVFDQFLEDQFEGVNLLLSSLDRSAALVSSFKQIAVDRHSEAVRKMDLRVYLNEICLTIDHSVRKTPHQLVQDVEDDIRIESFPGVISQVVLNLINNALLHAFADKQKGTIRLSAYQESDEVVLSVEDDGVGMDEFTRKHVFDPFFTTKMGQGGSGLGMHICHNLVSGTLQGVISVDSIPKKGSRVWIRIPKVLKAIKEDQEAELYQ